jgi:hypothetical protein
LKNKNSFKKIAEKSKEIKDTKFKNKQKIYLKTKHCLKHRKVLVLKVHLNLNVTGCSLWFVILCGGCSPSTICPSIAEPLAASVQNALHSTMHLCPDCLCGSQYT